MTLEQLRIFAAVAACQHVTRAAGQLHLTQAAVSAAIAALEQAHGVKLFDRVGRGIALTAAGRDFVPEAQAVLARAEAARAALADLAGLKRGRITLYASQTIASYFLPPCIVAFRARHPGVEVQLADGNTGQVAEALREGRAELGFVEGPVAGEDLHMEEVAGERMAVFVAAGHPWAAGAPLGAAELRAGNWVQREEGSGTRETFLAALRQLGIGPAELQVTLTLPSNEAVREAVAVGAGAACLSPLVCGRAVQAGVLARANISMPWRPFYAVRHASRNFSRAAAAFLETVKTF